MPSENAARPRGFGAELGTRDPEKKKYVMGAAMMDMMSSMMEKSFSSRKYSDTPTPRWPSVSMPVPHSGRRPPGMSRFPNTPR